ncbi:MAG: hypothetical protein M3077_05790 [Candidatus Dormibacteraeota bacterium]|nr:hypothetical protein [Candidatus Dormibacteraeota bacterium]
MAIQHRPQSNSVARILVEAPRVLLTGAVAIDAPDTADYFEEIAEAERFGEFRRILELGTQTAQTIRTSTTLRLVEAQVASMTAELNVKLGGLLVKDRGEAIKQTKEILDDHRAKITTTLTRYLDPESQASLPAVMAKVFDTAAEGLIKRVEKLLEEGDDSALGRLAVRFSKELDKAVALLIEQMAARHALLTKSSLAGRPYEDALEERLIALARPLGDKVTRCADALGQARTRMGDMIITIAAEAVRGESDVRIAVEAKLRGEKAHAFSPREIQDSLTGARRNRAAAGGIFVAESAGVLPLGLGFHEFGSANFAVAFDPAGDDIGLAVAYRLVRLAILQDVLESAGEEIDRDAYRRIVVEIRIAMGKLDTVRGSHQSAINSINKAATGVNDLADSVLHCLRQLDELMGA